MSEETKKTTTPTLGEDAQVAKIVREAEKTLLESPLYKWLRSALLGVLLLGVILWAGGAIYSGVQIASIKQQSDQTLSKITEIEARVTNAEGQIRKMFDQEVDQVRKFAKESQDQIEKRKAEALQAIDDEQKRAIEKLNVKALPDLRQLKDEISSLEKDGGKLNLNAIRRLVGLWWWIITGVVMLAAFAAGACWVYCKKSWRNAAI